MRATTAARAASDNGPARFLARLGFAASGLLHILIGVIAMQVATGGARSEADQSGALAQVAATPGGAVVLWVLFVGLAALGLYLIVDAFLSLNRGRAHRGATFATGFAKGIVYLVLAATAFGFARGSKSSSAHSTSDASQKLLALPGGSIALVIIGVGICAVGVYLFVKGITQRFIRDIRLPSGPAGRATTVLGVCGYVAKGVALAAVGVLFAVAGFTHNASQANGLDGGLKVLATLPFGAAVLVVVGIGLIAYGVYSFVRARYAKI